MTKKQKQDAERAKTLLQNQNIIVPQLGGAAGDGEKPKKPYYGKLKPVKKAAGASEVAGEKPSEPSGVAATKSATPESKADQDANEEELEEEEEEEEEEVDDWEKIAEQDFTEGKSPINQDETRNASPLVDKLRSLEVKEATHAEEDESGENS
jgi:hypothetical protein